MELLYSASNGKLTVYVSEGLMTDDPIEEGFFGCAGVAHIDRMEDVFMHIGRHGHRHHVNIAPGLHADALREALERYLGFGVAVPQREPSHAV